MSPSLAVGSDVRAVCDDLAEHLVALAAEVTAQERHFRLAISGGSTPNPLWEQLGGPLAGRFPWGETDLFWVDERMVPPAAPESNYGEAERRFVGRVPIPPDQVHRIRGESGAPGPEADRYERSLRTLASSTPTGPLFDVVLLGVGPDGHTASLFPGRPTLAARERWVVSEPQPGQPPLVPRVTLTLEAIAGADRAFFLATGPEKSRILAAIWSEDAGSPGALPAARVRARRGVRWYVDAAAAAQWPAAHQAAEGSSRA